jgi:hypothetical protein
LFGAGSRERWPTKAHKEASEMMEMFGTLMVVMVSQNVSKLIKVSTVNERNLFYAHYISNQSINTFQISKMPFLTFTVFNLSKIKIEWGSLHTNLS